MPNHCSACEYPFHSKTGVGKPRDAGPDSRAGRCLTARLATLLVAGALSMVGAQISAVELSISCSAVGQELEFCKQGVAAWERSSGHKVSVVSTPNATNERLALYQQLLAAEADDIDVFQIDVIWPGILGSHFIDLEPYSKDAESAHFASIIDNNTIDGKLLAIPWYTDGGVLYYRKDLLHKYGADPPSTWRQLDKVAERIQNAERAAGNKKLWGYVWQGRAYEGLTCNALEWIDSYGGGTIVDSEGNITVDNPLAAEALTLAASWVGRISPPGVLNYAEEEARGVFQSGHAVFMRNWPYAWSLANGADSPVKSKVGVVALPRGGEGGKHTGTLGGWQLAVSKYSKHPKESAELVLFLTSSKEQKRRAVAGSYNPTIRVLYDDAQLLEVNPFLGSLYDVFVNAVARPSRATGARYNQVSNAFWNAVHVVLSGKTSAEDSLSKLARKLKRMSRGGKW